MLTLVLSRSLSQFFPRRSITTLTQNTLTNLLRASQNVIQSNVILLRQKRLHSSLFLFGGMGTTKGNSYRLSFLIFLFCFFESSLAATIRLHRPDLLPHFQSSAFEPIPAEMPSGLLEKASIPSVADIGQPITACFLTAASADPTNW